MKLFGRLKTETFRMFSELVDELAERNSCVSYQLVRQDLSDRTADAKRMETKSSNETVRSF